PPPEVSRFDFSVAPVLPSAAYAALAVPSASPPIIVSVKSRMIGCSLFAPVLVVEVEGVQEILHRVLEPVSAAWEATVVLLIHDVLVVVTDDYVGRGVAIAVDRDPRIAIRNVGPRPPAAVRPHELVERIRVVNVGAVHLRSLRIVV